MRLELPEVAVVTGTSAGLGTELARTLLHSGCRVVGVDVAPPPPALTAQPDFWPVTGGMQEPGTWEQVADRIADWPQATLCYAAVAAVLVQGKAHELSPADWARALQVNVVGSAMGLAALRERLVAQGGGQVVFVGSVNATFGEEALVAYNASKGALRQVVRSCALDYGPEGIRVNMVSPGAMLTEMFLEHLHRSPDPAAMRAAREARQPLGRITLPSDVANAVAFLLSRQAAGISGADVVVDGGLTACFEFRHYQSAGTAAQHA